MKYTAEEVRKSANWLYQWERDWLYQWERKAGVRNVRAMLIAYAERIEAGEGAVPMGWLAADGSGRVIDAKAKDAGKRSVATGSAAAVYSIPLFAHPPAQAAQDDWRIGFFERWRKAAHEKGYAGVAEAIMAAPPDFLRGTTPAPAPSINLAAVREVIAHLRSFRSNTPPTWAHLEDAADKLEAAIKGVE